ncbi:hypothetical protein OWM54_43165 [Myxococcus sp. MISCRS1]|uniref:hypothetical protein n=1 Tax=Myxococcus sp. MISCRS1 TaxID=2996786 RepID=UPI00226DBA3B|nr:hypothetical protein [Myxococcus sp. MISCRS1]MCY1003967.1 hypothetical protein [Myxococcus sp. MISCRS1]
MSPLVLISQVQLLMGAFARIEELVERCPDLSGRAADVRSVTSHARRDLEELAAGAGILLARNGASDGSNVSSTVGVLSEAATLVQALHAGLNARRATIIVFPPRPPSQSLG